MDAKILSNRVGNAFAQGLRAARSRWPKRPAARIAAAGGIGVLAVVLGFWLAAESSSSLRANAESHRLKQVTEGIQSVTELFSRDVESVRAAAKAVYRKAKAGSADEASLRLTLAEGILYYAELESA
jgi:hypothetical protein